MLGQNCSRLEVITKLILATTITIGMLVRRSYSLEVRIHFCLWLRAEPFGSEIKYALQDSECS